MNQKRVAAIHDISCFGRCSLTVALPVLSAAGIETSVIPTVRAFDAHGRLRGLHLPRPHGRTSCP